MALFDDISKTLAGKSREAAQKAKDVAEIVQLKAQASSEKSKVRSLYEAIGQLYYKNHRNDSEDEYQSIVNEITETLARIAELQEKVRKLDGTVICPSCGAVIKKGNSFCGKCGAAAPVPVVDEEEDLWEEEPVEAEVPEEAPAAAAEEAAETPAPETAASETPAAEEAADDVKIEADGE